MKRKIGIALLMAMFVGVFFFGRLFVDITSIMPEPSRDGFMAFNRPVDLVCPEQKACRITKICETETEEYAASSFSEEYVHNDEQNRNVTIEDGCIGKVAVLR